MLTDLKHQGKIRAAGLSNHDICQLEAAESVGNVDAIQPPFNLIHRDAADDVLLWAGEHESGVIVYSPMASGLLTGAFSAERAASLEPGDWRRGHPMAIIGSRLWYHPRWFARHIPDPDIEGQRLDRELAGAELARPAPRPGSDRARPAAAYRRVP